MDVLHVITALNVGGAETMLAKLVEHEQTVRCGVRSTVLSLMPPGPAGERIRAAGVPLDHCGIRSAAALPAALPRLSRAIRDCNPDLIVGWMYHAQLAAWLGAKLHRRRLPVLWNVRHSLHDIAFEKPATRAIIRAGAMLSRHPRAIIYNAAVSATQYEAIGYASDRTVVIPNGFDCDHFAPVEGARERLGGELGVDPNALLVGMAARNHPMKDPATLVDAVRLARDTGVDVHLLILGEGMTNPDRRLLSALEGLPPNRVTLREHHADMAALLPGLDVLALPSAWGEGFPNILGEAMACGVPSIATDVGDSADIIGDPSRIIDPGDAGALSEALIRVAVMGRDQRRWIGRQSRERVIERFSLGAVAGQYWQLYERVLETEAKTVTATVQPRTASPVAPPV